jgi:hypothetical protein
MPKGSVVVVLSSHQGMEPWTQVAGSQYRCSVQCCWVHSAGSGCRGSRSRS